MDIEAMERMRNMWSSRGGPNGNDRFSMPELPMCFRRLEDGDTLTIGGHDWHVIVGAGHSPEHACLHCRSLGVLIPGDQILPEVRPLPSVLRDAPHTAKAAFVWGFFADAFSRDTKTPGSPVPSLSETNEPRGTPRAGVGQRIEDICGSGDHHA